MEKNKEAKTMKMNLWTFYVLVASLVTLLVATVSGWLLVAKLEKAQADQAENKVAIVRSIN